RVGPSELRGDFYVRDYPHASGTRHLAKPRARPIRNVSLAVLEHASSCDGGHPAGTEGDGAQRGCLTPLPSIGAEAPHCPVRSCRRSARLNWNVSLVSRHRSTLWRLQSWSCERIRRQQRSIFSRTVCRVLTPRRLGSSMRWVLLFS